ncbi:MAG: hypothetical protein OER12_09555 [Acidimicrobiia bacterium]|nr:hypothetical protein [Acidimicrobiia bacterium]
MEELTRTCPQCGSLNGVDAQEFDDNRDSGVELWGECFQCHGRFRLSRPGDGGHGTEPAGTSTPIASPYLFHMWDPLDR